MLCLYSILIEGMLLKCVTHQSGNLWVAQLKAPDTDLSPQHITLILNCHEQRFQGSWWDAWRGLFRSYKHKLERPEKSTGGNHKEMSMHLNA